MHCSKSIILCVSFLLHHNLAFPQNSPTPSNSQHGYNWINSDSERFSRSFKGKSDSETIPSKVLEKHQVGLNMLIIV